MAKSHAAYLRKQAVSKQQTIDLRSSELRGYVPGTPKRRVKKVKLANRNALAKLALKAGHKDIAELIART